MLRSKVARTSDAIGDPIYQWHGVHDDVRSMLVDVKELIEGLEKGSRIYVDLPRRYGKTTLANYLCGIPTAVFEWVCEKYSAQQHIVTSRREQIRFDYPFCRSVGHAAKRITVPQLTNASDPMHNEVHLSLRDKDIVVVDAHDYCEERHFLQLLDEISNSATIVVFHTPIYHTPIHMERVMRRERELMDKGFILYKLDRAIVF